MSDKKLKTYHRGAVRILDEPEHPKFAAAQRALPMIEQEIDRRTAELRADGADDGAADDEDGWRTSLQGAGLSTS